MLKCWKDHLPLKKTIFLLKKNAEVNLDFLNIQSSSMASILVKSMFYVYHCSYVIYEMCLEVGNHV